MASILTQHNLHEQQESKKKIESDLLDKLGVMVHDICHFGSPNQPGPKAIAAAFRTFSR